MLGRHSPERALPRAASGSIGMKRTAPPLCGADRRKLPDGWSEASEPDVKPLNCVMSDCVWQLSQRFGLAGD